VKETAVSKRKRTFRKVFLCLGKKDIDRSGVVVSCRQGRNSITNGKEVKKYFTKRHSEMVGAPLKAVGMEERFDVSAKVNGGGIMGQAEAVRLGVARALILHDENLKKTLKDLGYLTRDARIVERKKPGRRKARRSPQWAKR
jgi:small subunit ribosomal protein S9